MFKTFFLSSFRAIKRQKFYSFLNVFGLSVGIACAILMFTYIQIDLLWDAFQKNSNEIYRVNSQVVLPDKMTQIEANTPPAIGPYLVQELPEFKEFTRMYWAGRFQLKVEDHQRYEDAAFKADSSFFKIFTFPLKSNHPEDVLSKPDHIVLREDVAKFYFGDKNPLDQTIVMDDTTVLKVAGVYSIPDPGSFFQPNVIIPVEFNGWQPDMWNDSWMQTFVLTDKQSDPISAFNRVEATIRQNLDEPENTFMLQPFSELHLHSDHVQNQVNWHPGDATQVYVFLSVAILIILLASINYTNLAIARASHRTREIGMRKAIGALRGQIAFQFLAESGVTVFFSLFAGLLGAKLLAPVVSEMTQRQLSINLTDPVTLGILISIGLVITLLAGIYPALFLSGFRPVIALKGDPLKSKRFNWFRYSLIVFQFSTTLLLLLSVSVIYLQMNFIKHYDVGFNKDHVVLIRVEDDKRDFYDPFFNRLQNIPGVLEVAKTNGFPGWGDPKGTWLPEGIDTPIRAHSLGMGANAPELFGIKLNQGRWLDSNVFPTDEYSENDPTMAVLINETFVKELNWDNPIGKIIRDPDSNDYHMEVVGVVNDFHQRSLREKIRPTIIHLNNHYFQILVKIDGRNTTRALDAIDHAWSEVVPNAEISRYFYDEDMFVVHYDDDERSMKLLTFFTTIALIVASLGLIGLASYTAERRTREMGVRKILGAGVGHLMGLMQKEYVVLILIANAISWPFAWLITHRWLDEFVYKADYPLWIYPATGVLVLSLALFSTGVLTLKVIRQNPSKVLRHE